MNLNDFAALPPARGAGRPPGHPRATQNNVRILTDTTNPHAEIGDLAASCAEFGDVRAEGVARSLMSPASSD